MQHQIKVVSHSDGVMVVELSGEIHASVYEEFDSVIFNSYNADKCDVVLDCKNLAFIDSTILGAIVRVFKQLKSDGKKLTVKNLSPRIRKLFEICALDKLLELE